MHHAVLQQVVLLLAVAAISAYAMRRLRVPAIAGYVLAGMLVGPGGFGVVAERGPIEILAEIGVVLLLFSVGLKVSVRELLRLKGFVFGAGTLQVVLTVAGGAALASMLGLKFAPALVWGYLIALSSTALVLNLLEERGEVDSAQGRWMIGVLIFQDLAVIPILVSLPLLGGLGQVSWVQVAWLLTKSLLILVSVGAGARLVFPWLTEAVVRIRSREVFTLTAFLVALGVPLLVAEFGLSMALGAFLAGVVVSESAYSQQILADIAPLRDAFNSLFFVSIGMLVEPSVWFDAPLLSGSLFLGMVLLKGFIVAALAFVTFRSAGLALIASSGLAHVGEFSFVVAGSAVAVGAFDTDQQHLFLAVAVPTMLLAPLAFAAASRIARQAEPRRGPAKTPEMAGIPHGGHVIVVGFGLNGRNVARALRLLEVPYVVLELNPASVRELRRAGEPAVYGDASRELVLQRAGIERAKTLVVAIADVAATRQIVAIAHRANPGIRIVVRTRYVYEIEALRDLGADDVVPEEFETSLELTGRVLASLGAPAHIIEREKAILRQEQYGLLMGAEPPAAMLPLRALLADANVQELKVEQDAPAIGQSLRELELRRRTGVTVLAIRRGGQLVSNLEPDFKLAAGDDAIVIGTAAAIETARELFSVITRGA